MSDRFSEPEEMREYFNKLGLGEDAVQVYIALLRSGKTGVGNLSRTTTTDRAKVYRMLKILQEFKLVELVGGNPMKFQAMNFEDAINSLLQSKEDQLNQMKEQKESILRKYGDRFKAPDDTGASPLRVRISEGIDPVISTINTVVQKARYNINLMLDKRNMLRIYSRHTIVYLSRKASEGIKIRMLLPKNGSMIEITKDIIQKFEIRVSGIADPFSYITSDGNSVFILLESRGPAKEGLINTTVSGFEIGGTDSVNKLNSLFDYVWEKSEDFEL